MKKQLLTTTAMVAAGVLTVSGSALADKPKLTLGGSTEQIFGVGNNSDAFDAANGQRVGFDQHSDGEIFFNGSVTLDNGIKIRTRVELESNTESNTGGETANVAHTAQGDTIDEHWMRISGSFGEVRLGTGDAAAQAMTTGYLGTWATGVGQNLAFDTGDWISNPAAVSVSTVGRVDVTSDGEQISYFTPRFAGFQAGISYIPSTDEDVNNQRALSGGNADFEGWSLGVNFDRKFGGVGVGIALGYNTMNESTAGRTDPEVWGIGARVDFSGFRLAASWVDRDSQETAGVTSVTGQETIEVGARYTFGPNAVSISHLSGESTATSNATGDGDEGRSTFVAYRRVLGPGVFWKVTGIFADFDNNATGAVAATSNDGEALTTSIEIRF
jgi:outer membrane protein OmpU